MFAKMTKKAPIPKIILSLLDNRAHVSGLLEVTDLPNQKLRYIPIPG